ncbi:MAG: hypothetical protein V4677_12645 [Bacteroidota bacterium]
MKLFILGAAITVLFVINHKKNSENTTKSETTKSNGVNSIVTPYKNSDNIHYQHFRNDLNSLYTTNQSMQNSEGC